MLTLLSLEIKAKDDKRSLVAGGQSFINEAPVSLFIIGDFGNGKIGLLFRSMFLPTLIGMIFNSALTLIDGIFVGQGVGAEGIAAVNIVAPIFMIATDIGLMFGIVSSVVASIRLSENNIKSTRIIMTQAFLVGGLLIGIICIWCFISLQQVVRLL